ncbi:MAG: excalibur calcium-binding domain-containing protein [Kineosporiaceae bacterium]
MHPRRGMRPLRALRAHLTAAEQAGLIVAGFALVVSATALVLSHRFDGAAQLVPVEALPTSSTVAAPPSRQPASSVTSAPGRSPGAPADRPAPGVTGSRSTSRTTAPTASRSAPSPTSPSAKPTPTARPTGEPSPSGSVQVFYKNCAEVAAAGVEPLLRGQPGYRDGLDKNGDGVACSGKPS